MQGYRNQSTKESIKILLSLFDYYKDIEPFHKRYDLEADKLKTFKNARKYSFISNLIGGKKQYEENLKRISDLKAELESLTYTTSDNITQEEIEDSKRCESLKENKLLLETQLTRLQRRSNLIDISIEYGLMPTEADLQALLEFFSSVDIKKIYEVENYHKKLSSILNTEFEKEKELVNSSINEIKNTIDSSIDEMLNIYLSKFNLPYKF